MEELQERALAAYGPEARIIRAESVTVGGIKGYLARRHFEVTVHVPSAPHVPSVPQVPSAPQEQTPALRSRAGIAALLLEAEEAESGLRQAPGAPPVSTASGAFNEFVQDLAKTTGAAPVSSSSRGRRAALVRQPGRYPGDLTLVVGLEEDALAVCLSMARHVVAGDGAGRGVYTGGHRTADGYLSLGNRSGATAARAAGVEGGYPVFVAWGIDSGPDWDRQISGLTGLGADQVWIAVDARRKPADTGQWVAGVKTVAPISAAAVQHSRGTNTPETVNLLGIPIGWLDGNPALAPVLRFN